MSPVGCWIGTTGAIQSEQSQAGPYRGAVAAEQVDQLRNRPARGPAELVVFALRPRFIRVRVRPTDACSVVRLPFPVLS